MYTVHNTTHTVHCRYKINHVKDKYMYTIQCTMYTQPVRYAASFISYVLCVCLYDLFLAPGVSCYKHCVVTNIAHCVILYNLHDLLRTGLSCLKMAQACNSNQKC